MHHSYMHRPAALLALSGLLFSISIFAAWDLENGDFSDGLIHWNTGLGLQGASCEDINGDGRIELVLDSSQLIDQDSGVIAAQDFSPRYIRLDGYGIALRADIVATNLELEGFSDIRAFTKMEFLDADSNTLHTATVSGEYDPLLYATGNVARRQAVLVVNAHTLASNLALMGRTVWNVKKIRAGCFLFRFDPTQTLPSGKAYFENVALGRVSELDYGMHNIVNADFEFDNWAWMHAPRASISSTSGWSVVDIDNDGDKEACFSADDLASQYAGRLWVQDVYTYPPIAWTSGVSLTADIVASNLTPGLRAFHKLEFGGPSYNSPAFPGVFVSSEYPNTAATGNMARLNSTITMTYDNLVDQLALQGRTISDIAYIRSVIFLMQFDESPPSPAGFAYFDNLRLDFQYAESELNPYVNYTSQIIGDQITLTWGNLTTSATYHVQRADTVTRKYSNVVQNIFSFDYSELTVTTALHGAAGCYRVVKGPYMADPE